MKYGPVRAESRRRGGGRRRKRAVDTETLIDDDDETRHSSKQEDTRPDGRHHELLHTISRIGPYCNLLIIMPNI